MHIKNKTLDVLVKTKSGEINIEINSLSDRFLRRRNAGYIFKRYSDSVEVGESYQDMPRFIQINLTANLSKDYPLTSKYLLYDKDNNLTFIDNLIIYEINLKKYTQMCYNKKEKNILCMLDMNYEELVSVKGDMYMDKLKDEAIKLNNDEEFVKYLPDEVEDRLLKNSLIQAGYEEGTQEKTIELTINMLKENIDINAISKVTGLSINEINKLKDNL